MGQRGGWFGRSRPAADPAASSPKNGSPRALTTVDELRRRAEWPTLTDAERTALLAPYAALPVPPMANLVAAERPAAAIQSQELTARLVEGRFQREAASIVSAWLRESAPDAHLIIFGRSGYGAVELVAARARAAMVGRPAAPDFCFVPHPTLLDRPIALAVPAGMGLLFLRTLAGALDQICQIWQVGDDEDGDEDDEDGNGDDGDDDDHSGGASASDDASAAEASTDTDEDAWRALARQIVANALETVRADIPEQTHLYLTRLQSGIQAAIDRDDVPAFCRREVPIGTVHVNPDEDDDGLGAVDPNAVPDVGDPAPAGAPVVLAQMSRMSMGTALLRANGGVLIVDAADLLDGDKLSESWQALIAALRSRTLLVKPDLPPLPLAVRVAVVGSGGVLRLLLSITPDFARVFRYEAILNGVTDWDRETEAVHAALLQSVARGYELPAFDPTAVGRVIEERARAGGGRNRALLPTYLMSIHDLGVEVGRTAADRGATVATAADVDTVIQRRRQEYGVEARRVHEGILLNLEIVPTAGEAIGQINGLTVAIGDPPEASYGLPTRISATVSPGRDERLVDVDREARAVDRTHIQGALTMAGYLTYRYGADRPISASARIHFEQLHNRTEGDSASAAELFALLSALARVPIRRALAVTGAVGQYGEIQPIGGVNHKIEGFWEICRVRRERGEQPTGSYGVLIPAANVDDLMLRPEVAASIAGESWFHIWPIRTVDDGLPLLTGLPAAEIHARVDRRLQRFYELAAPDRE